MAVIPAPEGQPIVGNEWWWQNPLDPVYDVEGAIGSGKATVSAAGQIGSTVSSAVNTVSSAASTTVKFSNLIGNLAFWKGVGLVLAGGLIILVIGIQLVRA